MIDNAFLERFGALGGGEPPAKKLALLTRPAFVAGPGKTLVWGDWSNIEARVLPWLADNEGGEAKLDIFRGIDADPSMPDVYTRTAADLLGIGTGEVNEAERQSHGKVPELSLGYGGGVGALMNMGINYGVYVDPAAGQSMVDRWRGANGWARIFWDALWTAVKSAMEDKETIFTAGRVAYVFDPRYLGGTLFCSLPDGYVLTYPSARWEWREVEDRKTKKVEERFQLTYLRGYTRSALWYGKLTENITQAVAARILRRCLTRLDLKTYETKMPVVMHTHDEIVVETNEWHKRSAGENLLHQMEMVEPWAGGLPLKAKVESNWYYTKGKMK